MRFAGDSVALKVERCAIHVSDEPEAAALSELGGRLEDSLTFRTPAAWLSAGD